MPLTEKDGDRLSAPIAVVGVGNQLVSYDRIGPRVLDISRGRYGPDVDLFNIGTAGLSLLDCMCGQDLMLVVDACDSGGKTGDIRVAEMKSGAVPAPGPGLHQIGPMETLAVAGRLFPEKIPRRVLFVLVETGGIDEMASEKAARQAAAMVEREIARYRTDHAGSQAHPMD